MHLRHVWKIVEKEEQPSPAEVMYAQGRQMIKESRGLTAQSYTRKPLIVTYRCEVCGTERVERV